MCRSAHNTERHTELGRGSDGEEFFTCISSGMAPQLRGMVQRNLRNSIIRAMILGIIGGCAWKFGYADPKRRRYEEFYRNYDAEKVAKQMEAEIEALA